MWKKLKNDCTPACPSLTGVWGHARASVPLSSHQPPGQCHVMAGGPCTGPGPKASSAVGCLEPAHLVHRRRLCPCCCQCVVLGLQLQPCVRQLKLQRPQVRGQRLRAAQTGAQQRAMSICSSNRLQHWRAAGRAADARAFAARSHDRKLVGRVLGLCRSLQQHAYSRQAAYASPTVTAQHGMLSSHATPPKPPPPSQALLRLTLRLAM